VERICPYLGLADDGRTAVDGFDPEHRCHALSPPATLDRSRQAQLCLTEAHARCERFGAARTAWLAASSGLPRVAPDVAFGRTRMILEPDPAWRGRAGAPVAGLGRRALLLAGAGGTLVAAFALAGLSGVFRGVPVASGSPVPDSSASAAATPGASQGPASSAASSSAAASATVAPAETPSPAASQQIYVVQAGDTLNEIAGRFGTTVAAIQAANGLSTTEITVGQELIIP
jgi:LysM repeat protein